MSKPYFSILVPVFNQVGKMDRCIESIKAQTFEDYEVIFVDDGSTDDSLSMLEGFAAEDDRYRVVSHGENKSLLCARYTGMKEAQGERIMFLDSDDFFDPETLETIHDELMKNPVDVVRMGVTAEPIGVQVCPPEDVEDILGGFFDAKFPPQIVTNCITSEIAKKLITEITPPYCNNGEDTFMAGTVYTLTKSFIMLQKPFYHYVIVGGMSRELDSMTQDKLTRIKESLDNCSNVLIPYIEKHAPAYADKCRAACKTMYKYELCHFVLTTTDERQAVDFLNRFNDDWLSDVFEYGCKDVLREYFRRKIEGKNEMDIVNYYGF